MLPRDRSAEIEHARTMLARAVIERCTVARLLWSGRVWRLCGDDDDGDLPVDPGPRLVEHPARLAI